MPTISDVVKKLTFRNDKRPVLLEVRSSKFYIVLTVALSIFTDLFLYGVIVPVVPWALHQRAGVAEDQTQYWVSILLAVYGAALLAGSPIAGYISDVTTTRRLPFISGLLLLIGATIMLCIGDSIVVFVLGRVLQGFSSAIVWVTGLVIIVDTAGQKNVGQYMGYVGLAMSLAVLLSPLVGGVVYDRAGYYAVFAICFALLGLDVVMRLTMIERQVAARWLDITKPTTKSETATPELDQEKGPEPLERQRTFPSRRGSLPIRQSSQTPAVESPPDSILRDPSPKKWHQSLPPIVTLLGSHRLLASLWGSMIQAALLTSFDSTIPLRVRQIFGWNSLGAGLIFLPLVLPSFTGPLIGYISDRLGPKWPATIGFTGAVPALVCLRFVTHESLSQKVLLCALLACSGFCNSIVLTPFMAEIAYVVEEKERRQPGLFGEKGAYAQAYGLFNLAFSAGILAGPIWGGLVKEKAGWGTMVWTLGLLSGFSAVITLLWVGGWIGSVGMRGGGGHGTSATKDESKSEESAEVMT